MSTRILHVITAVHNRYRVTEEFLDSLKRQTFQDFRLILVDDGSTDGTDKMVMERMPDATILYGNGNLWWGGALHRAYQHIKKSKIDLADYVLIVNNDAGLGTNFLRTGVDLLESNPGTFIPGTGYSTHDGSLQDGAVHWDFRTGKNWILQPGEPGNCASTRALFFRVGDFLRVGGFHPILLPHYGSDYEFGIRAWRKGYQIRAFPELTYTFDEKRTGDRDYLRYDTASLLVRMFDKRSSFNPLYKLSLLVLVTPLPLLVRAIACQFGGAIAKRRSSA